MNILILEDSYKDLIISRKKLGDFLTKKGLRVLYACPFPENKKIFPLNCSRDSISYKKILKQFINLKNFEKKNNIQKVISFRLVPNIFNYVASFINNKPKRICVITGLGIAFSKNNFSYKIFRLLIFIFYKIISYKCDLIVQNSDDKNTLKIKANVINGSGVAKPLNTKKEFFKNNKLNLLYVGRLLKTKGIIDVINVFKNYKKINNKITLTIAGKTDPKNSDSISDLELKKITKIEGINYVGYKKDLNKIYLNSDVIMFLSNYREGVPRVLIEALSFGLTVVTLNQPGCKTCVRENGKLFYEINIKDISLYLQKLSKNKLIQNKKQSNLLFKKKFIDKIIYNEYYKILK